MSNMKAIQTFVRERPTNGRDGIVDPLSLVLDEGAKTVKVSSGKGSAFEIKYDFILWCLLVIASEAMADGS